MTLAADHTDKVNQESMRIGGKLVDSDALVDVINPFDNQVVGTIPQAAPSHIRQAFAIAEAYQPKLSRYERQQILFRTAEALSAQKPSIAALITAESGLSMKDSLYEVGRAYDVFTLAGQMAVLDDGAIFACDITPQGKERRIYTMREPLGAISAITPFNHPLNMVAHKIAPSVATNNCLVLKPAELTPLTALRLADIMYEAGLPVEMFQIITGRPQPMADEMITNPAIDLVSFTGGVPAGKYIAEHAGYRRTVLELGGNDPLIIMDDLDAAGLDQAASLAVAGATKNSGQRCTAVKRILCLDSVADAFVPLVLEKAKALKAGDPSDPETDIGTVITEQAACLFESRVKAAVEDGAALLHGNNRQGALYPPTVVDHVPSSAELVVEESFGPVIPILRCRDLNHVIETANGTAFGLSSGVCTNRIDVITRLVHELKVGTVNVWEVPGYRIEMSPFGGIKDSGLGYKEGVLEAMKSFTNVKTYSLPWPQ